jgi:hypothetical protein
MPWNGLIVFRASVLSRIILDSPLTPLALGERVASQVRGSPGNVIVKNYADTTLAYRYNPAALRGGTR